MPLRERPVAGWDVGGAHLKACLMTSGQVVAVAEWACPLWQGLEHLDRTVELAFATWPALAEAHHAVTMTGEMVDLFKHREDGVLQIAGRLAAPLRDARFYAGDAGWCEADEVGRHWAAIASANWLATARHVALAAELDGGDGVLVDIGSTTTDLIAFRRGRVLTTARSDAERLSTGELVYHGVVRTPLCALGPRLAWQGRESNLMNEWFATSADVYRLTGELDPAHDLQPTADNGAKDAAGTQRRLARMVGRDARELPAADWQAFARAWRARQVAELGGQVRHVCELHGLDVDRLTVVSAGCGDFLVPDVARAAAGETDLRLRRYGDDVARVSASAIGGRTTVAGWAQVCAPTVAVAALAERELARCGS